MPSESLQEVESRTELNSNWVWIAFKLWAFASLFSHLSSVSWVLMIPSIESLLRLIGLFAVLVAICSSPSKRVAITCLSLSTVNLIYELPELPNHCHVLIFLGLILLAAFLSANPWNKEIHNQTKSAIRGLTAIVYIYAALAKLNTSFFDSSVSCSGKFYNNIRVALDFLPPFEEPIPSLVIYGSVIVEIGIPVLIFFRRTNLLAVLLGLGFHLALSFDLFKYFTNFSGVMYALLLCSLVSSRLEGIAQGTISVLKRHNAGRMVGMLVSYIFFTVTMAVGAEYSQSKPAWDLVVLLRHVLWLIYASALIVLLLWTIKFSPSLYRKHEEVPRFSSIGLRVACIVVLFLAMLNGASPYLGLKTRTSFNMYSNGRIEATSSNHFLVPRSLDLLGRLSDSALVLAKGESTCNQDLLTGVEYPIVELDRKLRECPNETFELLYRQESISVPSDRLTQVFEERSSWLARKFEIFKALGGHAETDCVW